MPFEFLSYLDGLASLTSPGQDSSQIQIIQRSTNLYHTARQLRL